MKKILILEDNPLASQHLQDMVQELDTRNVVFTFHNIKDAYQCALEKSIDLFLVDIILDVNSSGDVSGLKFADNIRMIEQYRFVPIVFITSLEDVKLYSYEKIHCYKYIEKPFNPVEVKGIIEQCLRYSPSVQTTKTMFFRIDGVVVAIDREDIVYAESVNHMIHIHSRNGDVLKVPYYTVRKMIEELDSEDIFQCSRNTIVNKRYIENIDIPNQIIRLKNKHGIIMIGGKYKKQIKECFD